MRDHARVDWSWWLGRCALVGSALAVLSRCSPERRVLATDSTSDPNSIGGGPALGGGPAAGGSGGDLAAGGSSTAAGGSSTAAGGSSTAAAAGGAGTGGCSDVACPTSCDHGFELMVHTHGGCLVCECAPVSDCQTDTDCPTGSLCYAGLQCDDGCAASSCCSGNRCGPPGCPSLSEATCLAAGCPNGDVCLAQCDRATCACDGTGWTCDYDSGTTTSCASACAAP